MPHALPCLSFPPYRRLIAAATLCTLNLLPAAAHAADPGHVPAAPPSPAALAALQQQLQAEFRAELAALKQHYEARILALEQGLQTASPAAPSNPVLPAAPAAPAQTASPLPAAQHAAARANAFNPEISLILQGQYASRASAGLTDSPRLSGFWPATDGHAHTGASALPAAKRGFSLDHTELVLAANIDPYWRGQAVLAALDGEVEVEEAWFKSLGLDHGLGLKAGRLRSGIGYLNEQHPHRWDFANAPLAYRALFGEHANYTQDGIQLKWLAPTPLFLEFGAEAGRGQAFPGNERNPSGAGASSLFVHLGDDLGNAHSWRVGLSALHTRAQEREAAVTDLGGLPAQALFSGRSRTWIADAVWKWAPNGNASRQSVTLQGEYFQRRETGDLACLDELGVGNRCASGAGSESTYASRQHGWYVQGVYQWAPAWRSGVRYDRLQSGNPQLGSNAAHLAVDQYAPQRTSLMTDYRWSEFSRVRLQWSREQLQAGQQETQWLLQYQMSLGSHGAHLF